MSRADNFATFMYRLSRNSGSLNLQACIGGITEPQLSPLKNHNDDERYQLDATIMIFYHK